MSPAVRTYPFQDPSLPIDERVNDFVSRLDLVEKSAQMLHETPAITRLSVPPYNWWNEGLHGVARAGIATVFPQAIGLAAMFDETLHFEIAAIISDEARAKHHEFVRLGDHGMYRALHSGVRISTSSETHAGAVGTRRTASARTSPRDSALHFAGACREITQSTLKPSQPQSTLRHTVAPRLCVTDLMPS